MTSIVKKTILAGLAALTMGAGVAATTTSAEAQVVYGRGYRGYHGGYGYRPAYYGPRYGYYGYRRYNGGAVAAGVVGGLALGALAGRRGGSGLCRSRLRRLLDRAPPGRRRVGQPLRPPRPRLQLTAVSSRPRSGGAFSSAAICGRDGKRVEAEASASTVRPPMTIRFHRGDLPAGYRPGASIAIDTETLGLNPHRDRLCVVQISPGDGTPTSCRSRRTGRARRSSPGSWPTRACSRSSISPASTSPCCSTPSASCRARSTAPRSPRGSPAPIPTGTGSRTSSGNCSASTCRSSSNPPTGAPRR